MNVPEHPELTSLLDRTRRLLQFLESRCEPGIHQRIDQFYYMEKVEELGVLCVEYSHLAERLTRLSALLQDRSREVSQRLDNDLTWLTSYLDRLSASGY
jgi:hypothetical protein